MKTLFGINVHDFKCCDTFGGSSFRHWCMLYKHKAVFIGFDNYEPVIYFSSNPNAEWKRGIQDPCCNGSPNPYSNNAELLHISSLPEEVKPFAENLVKEAVEICKNRIIKYKESKSIESLNEQKKECLRHQKEVVDPWVKYVATTNPT